jgi:NADPH2:quinone reductase
MRAIQVQSYVSGPQDLTVTTLPNPTPSPEQYLIAIHATATNFFDLLQIRGKYQHQPPLPWISGSEFAGTILSTPPSNPNPAFRKGAKVFGAAQGGFATHICALEAQLRPVPQGWSFLDAAGLMITAPTSYAALVTRAGVKRGDYVLIHAAAGGVGLAAVQVAKAYGATVIATAGSARKLEVAKGYGADFGVDYNQPRWEDEVKRLTPKGRGVDIVFDPVGMVNTSLRCTAWNGRIVVVGFAAGDIEKVAMNRVLLKNVSLVGLHWGMYAKEEVETVEEVWGGLFRLIEQGKFKGTVYSDRKFCGLESVGEALGMLGSRETWGKVVVEVPDGEKSKL